MSILLLFYLFVLFAFLLGLENEYGELVQGWTQGKTKHRSLNVGERIYGAASSDKGECLTNAADLKQAVANPIHGPPAYRPFGSTQNSAM